MRPFIWAITLGAIAGCMAPPQSFDSQQCEPKDYGCNVAAETVQYMRKETYLDCQGKSLKTELVEYDGNQTLLRVQSLKNIPIEKGEFENPNNGTRAPNQKVEDGGWPKKHYDQQWVYVSGGSKPDSLKLNRGVNIIKYKYLTCEDGSASNCKKWGVQEEGVRTVLALYSQVLNRTCDRKAICSNGVIVGVESCTSERSISPVVLQIDYGREVIK